MSWDDLGKLVFKQIVVSYGILGRSQQKYVLAGYVACSSGEPVDSFVQHRITSIPLK